MSESRDELVLVLLPTAKDSQRTDHFLRNAGVRCKLCNDIDELCSEIGLGAGMAFVSEEQINADLNASLSTTLEHQAPWSDFPLVVLAREGYPKLVKREQINVTLLERPLKVRSLMSVVFASLRSRRRQYEVRDYLADREIQAKRLRDSELRYRLVGEAANDAIWDWDLATNDVVWNEGIMRLFGYAQSEVGSKAGWWLEKIHPDDRGRISDHIHATIDSGVERWQNAYRFRRADGTYANVFDRSRIVHQDSKPVRMVGSMLDLTERERAAAALSAAEERFTFVRRSSGVGFWYCDLPFDVLQWDEIVKEHFHLAPDATVTIDTFYARIHPADRVATRVAIEKSIAEHKPYDVCYRTVAENLKTEKWIRAIGRTTYSKEGQAIRFDGVTLDVTEQKRVEAELRDVAAALSEAGHRKDEFLATLAHELRNPLAPMQNAVHLMTLSTEPELYVSARTIMERQLSQMVRLVDDLMDLSRITRGKVELRLARVSVTEIIQSAVETCRPLIERMGHSLKVRLPQQPILIEADTTRMSQVLSNLLNNAAKYSDRGSQIELTVDRQDGQVLLHVRDNGIGIAPDQLNRIFEMFTQVDQSLEKSQGGLGIGLTLVRRLVELHGGSVTARSDGLGAGTEFTVYLPEVVTQPAVNKLTDTQASLPRSSRRILIVDDNRDGADSLALMLRILGNETRVAYDGEEGVQLAESYQPNVILFDIGLPKMNGYEACRFIRTQHWGKAPLIVAITGWGQDEDRHKSKDAGFDHHLVKPVDPKALLQLIA